MERIAIEEGLRSFAVEITSDTLLGTWKSTARMGLPNASDTRSNTPWKKAEYVVAYIDNRPGKDNPNLSIEDYLNGWRKNAKDFGNQNLFLEISPNEWRRYDADGNETANDEALQKFFSEKKLIGRMRNNKYPIQQIIYGAPGTGKSHEIKEKTKGKSVIRTTFHPDSDYSTFVGAYKPTMEDTETMVVPVVVNNGISLQEKGTITEKRIVYKFIMQAFLKAYLGAWKKYADRKNDEVDPQFLIIEEINRGNCAQIFGDLFQLLDRNDEYFSEYPIESDTDLQKEIERAFKEHKNYKLESDIDVEDVIEEYASNYDATLSEDIQHGRVLLLPPNLYIWATMNTSDQSLFPIDSAFKRRWEWKYIPIDTKKEMWSIAVEGENYSWTSFLEIANERVLKATSSEDKQLGFYFCKAQNNVISAETFVSKVLFYLWNDVFKDYDEGDSIFKDSEGKQLSFSKFYNTDGSVNNTTVKELLTALGIEKTVNSDVSTSTTEEDEEDEDGNAPSSIGKNYDKYSVNGIGRYGKNRLATESVRKYIELNPYMTADEVLRNWKSLGVIVPHFIESKEEYDARTDNSKRSYEIPCGDTIIYVAHNGYGSNGKVDELMNAVNNMDWGLALAKVVA